MDQSVSKDEQGGWERRKCESPEIKGESEFSLFRREVRESIEEVKKGRERGK